MDMIYIRDLSVECIIGVAAKERFSAQTVVLNITLEANLAPSSESDDINDTVNYRTLKDRLVDYLSDTSFFLIEKMAAEVARICLEEPRVEAVTVEIDKPGALTSARSVGVQIRRTREG